MLRSRILGTYHKSFGLLLYTHHSCYRAQSPEHVLILQSCYGFICKYQALLKHMDFSSLQFQINSQYINMIYHVTCLFPFYYICSVSLIICIYYPLKIIIFKKSTIKFMTHSLQNMVFMILSYIFYFSHFCALCMDIHHTYRALCYYLSSCSTCQVILIILIGHTMTLVICKLQRRKIYQVGSIP